MVVLDQHARREVHPVIGAAPRAHGVLLEHAPAGERLAGVEDLGAGALHRVDVARGDRRDAGQVLHEIQSDALGRQQARGRGRSRKGWDRRSARTSRPRARRGSRPFRRAAETPRGRAEFHRRLRFARATSRARERRCDTTVAIVVMSLKAPSSTSAARTSASSASCVSGKRSVVPLSTAGTDRGVIVRGIALRSRWGSSGVSIGTPPPLSLTRLDLFRSVLETRAASRRLR